MTKLFLTAALLATTTSAIARTRDVAATPIGEPVNCLRLTDIRETHVRSDSVIDFVTRGGKVYRNTLPNACPSLGFEERFSYQVSTSELCSVDIVTVLYSSPDLQRGASCGLGKFQPVQLAKK